MANKRQKKMEESPEDKTRMGGDKPKPKIDISFDINSMPQFSKEQMDKAMESMRKAVKMSEKFYSYGGGEKARGGGNIFIEGMGDFNKQFGSNMSGTLRNLFGPNWMDALGAGGWPDREDQMSFKDAVARLLHSKAVEVWDSLLNWQFAVTYNEGQATFWFTARYYDAEEYDNSEPLVSETIEFSEETLARRNWDETNLEVERQMERMHDKCEADLAAFE